jgi:hypothetical protein
MKTLLELMNIETLHNKKINREFIIINGLTFVSSSIFLIGGILLNSSYLNLQGCIFFKFLYNILLYYENRY